MKTANIVTPARNAAQPGLSSTLKIYSSKALPTIRVRLKKSKAKRVLIINEADFDPDRHVRLK